MKNILFICTGNTCRSPMAERFFNQFARGEAPEWQASSAGLHVSGTPDAASCNAIAVAREYGVDLADHRSQRLSQSLVDEAHLLLTMEGWQKEAVAAEFPQAAGKVHTLLEFVGEHGDIGDPISQSLDVYRTRAEEIMQAVQKLVDQLR